MPLEPLDRLYACPQCREALPDPAPNECLRCQRLLKAGDILDFVTDRTSEQAHYDELYEAASGNGRVPPGACGLDARARDYLRRLWTTPYYPVNREVLEVVGDTSGKVVLLLGNGDSEKELLLLDHGPRRLVFSDLSAAGVRAVRDRFPFDESAVPVRYAAIDALNLPFVDDSVDLLYGYAFVHHLGDPVPFFREAVRVLRPGGRAIFMDNRFVPIWQKAKLGILRPLMRYFHRKGGISPEDLHATLTGWYSEDQLSAMLRAFRVKPFFHNSLSLHYLVTRASERLPPQPLFARFRKSERALTALVAFDRWLSRFEAVRANQFRLVWGFDKMAYRPRTASSALRPSGRDGPA